MNYNQFPIDPLQNNKPPNNTLKYIGYVFIFLFVIAALGGVGYLGYLGIVKAPAPPPTPFLPCGRVCDNGNICDKDNFTPPKCRFDCTSLGPHSSFYSDIGATTSGGCCDSTTSDYIPGTSKRNGACKPKCTNGTVRCGLDCIDLTTETCINGETRCRSNLVLTKKNGDQSCCPTASDPALQTYPS